jgi:thioredoxin reductase (NADPH)
VTAIRAVRKTVTDSAGAGRVYRERAGRDGTRTGAANLMTDPYLGRRDQMFPRLTPAQLGRISAVGERRRLRAGEVLFELGEQNTGFFVVLEGAVEIVRPVAGREEPIIVHGPGEFTGEINMLSARRTLVRGRAVGDGAIVAVDREHLRALVQRDFELSEILMRAFILRRVALIAHGDSGLVLIGSRHSASTLRIREFLSRNAQPFTYQDVESDPDVQALLDRFQVGVDDVPVVVCESGQVLRNPSIEALATGLGLSPDFDATATRDVVIVGAGPAGLAAAVYAASEGLDVLVLETTAPGGQAGSSSRIENYLGFPTGISGQDLAGRALMQTEKFGAEVAIARGAVGLDCAATPYQVRLATGEVVRTRTVVIASGARYRKPALPELSRFEGAGVMYSATHVEAQLCRDEEIAIVGGGNSAGQAAVFLSQSSAAVNVLVRGPGLAESMSRYLVQRIEDSANVVLRARTQIDALQGTDRLEQVRWRHLDTGEAQTRPIRHLFLMTGADPNTAWLGGCVALDDRHFVKTGADLRPGDLDKAGWPLARRPEMLETSRPGVFAVGDARSGSVKRVASAVGEGSVCVQLIHRALREL